MLSLSDKVKRSWDIKRFESDKLQPDERANNLERQLFRFQAGTFLYLGQAVLAPSLFYHCKSQI